MIVAAKRRPPNEIVGVNHRLFHDDVELNLNIAIDSVYWQLIQLLALIHLDQLDLMDLLHFQWL